MTDWTTARVTPEMQAELRRLLDATETPWALWDGYGPDGNGDMRVARIGHLSGSGIRADPDSADIYGRREAFELLASAVNALPALLDAAAERDRLAEAVERVRALHGPRVVQVLGATCFAEECDHEDACPLVDYAVCGHCYDVGAGAHPDAYEDGGLQDVAHPCATYRALDAAIDGGAES